MNEPKKQLGSKKNLEGMQNLPFAEQIGLNQLGLMERIANLLEGIANEQQDMKYMMAKKALEDETIDLLEFEYMTAEWREGYEAENKEPDPNDETPLDDQE